MANVGKITHVKTNIGNTFSFSDKSAIKKIIFGKQDKGTNGVYSPDSDGIVYIKLKDSFKDFYKKILSIGNNNNDYIQNLYNEKIFPANNTEQNQNND